MNRSDRLFRIVQIMRNRRFVTAEYLAETLDVSMRTIYRDIRDIAKAGVPIRGEAGVGYQLERSASLPPMTFTAEEIEALVLGARMAVAWSDSELATAARSVLEKIEGMVPAPLREVLLKTALFAPSGPWTHARKLNLDVIRTAVGERRKLAFDYVNADGQTSRRIVRPLGLYFWGAKWSLAGWCELRKAYRSFRPDRMQDLEVLSERFDEESVDLDAFMTQRRIEDQATGWAREQEFKGMVG